jgi:hypothetical protein
VDGELVADDLVVDVVGGAELAKVEAGSLLDELSTSESISGSSRRREEERKRGREERRKGGRAEESINDTP